MPLPSHPIRNPLQQLRLPLLALAGLATVAAAGPARAVELPSRGIACDASRRICYDNEGPSILETRRRYGRSAEQKLLRQLSGRPPMQIIPFSSGELCDIQARQCWDDGWQRTNISNRLTRHLYGKSFSETDPGEVERRCELSQAGQPFYQGPCRFSRSQQGGDRRFLVELEDGRRYRFSPRGGRVWLSDASGDWQTRVDRTNRTISFQWADFQLSVDRPVGGRDDGRGSTEQLMIDLIDSLVR